MKSRIDQVLLVTCIAASVAGCGSSEDDPLADSAAADGCQKNGAITLYTSQPDVDVSAMVDSFNEEHPDVQVLVFRSGTEEVVSKLQAEKQAGAEGADIIFIADALSMEKLQSEEMLAPYNSPEADEIPEKYVGADGYYTGTKIITTGIAINTDEVTADPTSWNVLTEPEAEGAAEMPSPLYSGAAAYNVALFASKPEFGWDYWQAVADNGMTVTEGNGAVLEEVASGRKKYGMVVDFIVARAAAEGSPVKFVYPEEGVPAITEPIALAAPAEDCEAAKQFIDFVLSDAGQQVASDLGYVPIAPDAPVPDGLKGVSQLNVIEGDVAQLVGEVDAAKDQFDTMFNE